MNWLVINIAKIPILSILIFNGLQGAIFSKKTIPSVNTNSYISNYDEASFFKSNLAEQIIDLENIDEELLNATFFFELEKIRNKGHRKPFILSEDLNNTCKNIVTTYSGNSFKRFNKKKKNKIRFQKTLKKRAKESNFNGTFIEGKTDFLPLLKIKKKKKYIYSENIDGGENLFFYKKKEKKNGKKEHQPIESHTYQSFVDSIFKYQSKSKIRAKHFSELGYQIQVVQKSKKKIPYAKIIWVVGGYRLNLLDK